MTKDQIKELLPKYLSGTCTKYEEAILESWFLAQKSPAEPGSEEIKNDLDEVWTQLNNKYRPKATIFPMLRKAAASVILVLSVFGYYLFYKTPGKQQVTKTHAADIRHGGNQAILTLSNGKQIVLSGKQNGRIATQGRSTIVISNDGKINYNAENLNEPTAELVYNTITTPIGNSRAIQLTDGTEVTLDAGSSITYPVIFDKKMRNVSITGQAYFKVKHNAQWAFNVKVKGLVVKDIGTEFNINAYDDEPDVKTTLVSGSVSVDKNERRVTLKPGQQAITNAENNNIEVSNVDINPVVSWKNGDFVFKDVDFKTAMRQISRWYNVEMVYDKSTPINIVPGGWISRSKSLASVLRLIELSEGVHFKIEERRVMVTK